MRSLLKLSAVLALALVTAASSGAESIALDSAVATYRPDVTVLEDPAGTLSIEDVAGRTGRFRPTGTSIPNFGFSESTFWFHLSLGRKPDQTTRWYLEVGYPLLDVVELYWADGDHGYRSILVGDGVPFAARPVSEPQFYLPLDLPERGARDFYLRVRSVGSVTVPLRVWSERALDQQRGLAYLPLGLFFGTLAALALYNLMLFVSIRDTSYLYYVAFVLTAGMAYFGYTGLAYEFLWPEAIAWNNRSHVVFGFAALGLAALFTRRFLVLAAHSRFLDWSMIVLVCICAALAAVSVWPLSFWASARAFVALAFPSAVLVFSSGVVAWRRGYRPARWFLLAWATLIIGLLAYSLRFLNFLPANFFTIFGIQIGAGVEMVLLSIALADRINVMKHEKEQAQAQALAVSQRAEKELEGLVHARVAELRDTNRRLEAEITEHKSTQEELQRMAHHDPLTGLPNRFLLKDRFQITCAAASRASEMLAVLMIDLDDFKYVNDTLGHEVGDRMLVQIGKALRSQIRGTDTVARFGGDEFVILLGGLHDAEEAALIGRKIIAALDKPAVIDEHHLRVTPSIGIALFPQDGPDLDTLTRCADAAMYRAKSAGGNRFVFFLEGAQRQLSLPDVRTD